MPLISQLLTVLVNHLILLLTDNLWKEDILDVWPDHLQI